jgi:hypothetical protein
MMLENVSESYRSDVMDVPVLAVVEVVEMLPEEGSEIESYGAV